MIKFSVLGLAGVALLAVVGCGAEQGKSEGIGSSGEALSLSTLTSSFNLPATRQYAGSCVINDNGTKKLILAGGFDSFGTTPIGTTYSFTPGTGWSGSSIATMNHARGDGRMIQKPGDDTKCLYLGGATSLGGTAVAFVEELSVSGGVYTWTDKTAMNVARSKFALTTCGTRLVAIGGQNSSTRLNAIEVSDAASPASWSWYDSSHGVASNHLQTARYEFGFDKDPSANNYVIAGGNSASAAQDNSLELIKMTTSGSDTCVPSVTKPLSPTLTTGREGNVVVADSSTSFTVFAGKSAAGLPTDKDVLTVNWSGTPSASKVNTGSVLVSGTHLPTLVKAGTRVLFLGGDDAASPPTTPSSNRAQEYSTFNAVSLSTGRIGGNAEYFSATGKVYLVGGKNLSSGLVAAVEELTPTP